MNEVSELIELLQKKEPATALLAPSFPVVYSFPETIGKLKRLGFSAVVEVAVGAKITNEALLAWIKSHPGGRFITSPCPTLTRLIKSKYSQLEKYLTRNVDSPMVATARITRSQYPDHRPVFIGPCNNKKLEAREEHADLNLLVLTYKELDEVFAYFKIRDEAGDRTANFDQWESTTRLYPVSGGLAQSSGVREIFAEDETQVVSGSVAVMKALNDFEANSKVRLLDILFCNGGCISGPGIVSPLALDARRKKISDYWETTSLTALVNNGV